ncbi:MAG: pyrroline-5-carboxylate reductase [Rhizobiales bacterium]|nr:pyrroline-5-carboxylate reductase [Hyphomicrobiales bacterium]
MSLIISKTHPLVLVGAGKMGGAMLDGWLKSGIAGDGIHVIDPGLPAEQRAALTAQGVSVHDNADAVPTPLLMLLAVKPQMMAKVLPGLSGLTNASGAENTLVLSVAAGTTVSTLKNALGSVPTIIRAMPNTPALVGRGVTALYPSQPLSDEQKAFVGNLLEAIGTAVWVDHEEDIDSVTAVSGSGPAYVFHLVEALAAAACAQGLSPDVAMILARETVSGAGELLYQAEESAETLRKNVTSPNGTTQAGLDVLMAPSDGLGPLIGRTVQAAKDRAVALGKES